MVQEPKPQYLSAEHVLEEMCAFGKSRLEHLTLVQLFVLGVIGGAFITAGALFSVLLSDGVDMAAAKHVLAGLGFSAGFFFVILSHAALFTEANVVLPAVLSGILANWLVGMAAFFAVMGRTILGKYIPVALAVTLFVAANFQHSPANMGYFALATPLDIGPGWAVAIWWNIIPAGIGNMLGGSLLVALPFWFALHPTERDATVADIRASRNATKVHERSDASQKG